MPAMPSLFSGPPAVGLPRPETAPLEAPTVATAASAASPSAPPPQSRDAADGMAGIRLPHSPVTAGGLTPATKHAWIQAKKSDLIDLMVSVRMPGARLSHGPARRLAQAAEEFIERIAWSDGPALPGLSGDWALYSEDVFEDHTLIITGERDGPVRDIAVQRLGEAPRSRPAQGPLASASERHLATLRRSIRQAEPNFARGIWRDGIWRGATADVIAPSPGRAPQSRAEVQRLLGARLDFPDLGRIRHLALSASGDAARQGMWRALNGSRTRLGARAGLSPLAETVETVFADLDEVHLLTGEVRHGLSEGHTKIWYLIGRDDHGPWHVFAFGEGDLG